MWQEIGVILLVLASLIYLGRKYFLKPKTQPGCDKCVKP